MPRIATRPAPRLRAPVPAIPASRPASTADAAHPITVLQRNSLPALVQKELERMILAGDLAAGGKLNEASVADFLGVSRGPVREAFRALEETGLVRFEKNRGVFVRQISIEEADHIYEVRAALDEFIGRKLAATATAAQIKTLRGIVERMQGAAARDEVDAYYRLNLEFHEALVQFTGNPKLALTYRRLVNELNLFRQTTLARSGTLAASSQEHHEIVERIAAGDAEAAGRALRDHVSASRDRMHRTQEAVARPFALAPRKQRR